VPYDAEHSSSVRPSAHWILWAVVAFLLVGLLWAHYAEVDEVTIGQGEVIPSSRVQVVQNLEGGIIAEILVVPGQTVRRDELLMKIDDTRFSSSYLEGAAKDDALRSRIARLEAEAVSAATFTPPPDLLRAKPELVRQEQTVFDSRRRDLQAGLDVLEQQSEQRAQELAEMQARAGQLSQSYELVQKELSITHAAAEKNVFPQIDVIRLERQASDLKGQLDAAQMALPRLSSALQEVHQKARHLRAEFQAAASRELSEARAEHSRAADGCDQAGEDQHHWRSRATGYGSR
jgi:adhesin transport system membrane fusion protein